MPAIRVSRDNVVITIESSGSMAPWIQGVAPAVIAQLWPFGRRGPQVAPASIVLPFTSVTTVPGRAPP